MFGYDWNAFIHFYTTLSPRPQGRILRGFGFSNVQLGIELQVLASGSEELNTGVLPRVYLQVHPMPVAGSYLAVNLAWNSTRDQACSAY